MYRLFIVVILIGLFLFFIKEVLLLFILKVTFFIWRIVVTIENRLFFFLSVNSIRFMAFINLLYCFLKYEGLRFK